MQLIVHHYKILNTQDLLLFFISLSIYQYLDFVYCLAICLCLLCANLCCMCNRYKLREPILGEFCLHSIGSVLPLLSKIIRSVVFLLLNN